MPFNTNHKIQIVDASGDPCDNDSGALKVVLSASDDINIGNVVLQSDSGTDIYSVNAISDSVPDLDGQLLLGTHALLSARKDSSTTIGLTCEDSTHNALHVALTDGAGIAHVNGSNQLEVEVKNSSLAVTNAGTFATQIDGSALTALQLIDDAVHVDDAGFTLGSHKGMMMMGFAGTQSVDSNDAAALACTSSGMLKVSIGHVGTTTFLNQSDHILGSDVDTYSEAGDYGSVASAVRNDVLAALADTDNEFAPLQVDAQGALYTTHGMTGMTHGINNDVDTTAEQLDGSTSGLDTACKRVDLMAASGNTGNIYVGSTDAIAGDGSVGGIRLQAGDFYSIDVNNLNDIWIEASIANQSLNYIYYT